MLTLQTRHEKEESHMKKNDYIRCEMDIVEFDDEDIITTSTTREEDELPFVPATSRP